MNKWLLSLSVVFSVSAMGQAVDTEVRLDNVKDVDNPFAKKLNGKKVVIIDPDVIIKNLQALENKTNQQTQNDQPALVNAAELKDLQSVINALKQPAQQVEYIAKEKLPLISQPLSEYELRGVMVSFAEDPSLLTEYDTLLPDDLMRSEDSIHVVQGFETLESIATLYDTSVLAIETANGLLPNELLLPDTPLIVPILLPVTGSVTAKEYFLQIGALEIQSNNQVVIDRFAEKYVDILQGDRFTVLSPEVANSRYHKVWVGPYQTLEIAENKCFLIKSSGGECLLREQTKTHVDKAKEEIKINPTYVAIVGQRGTNDDFFVSEGDRLGNGSAIVVSIFEDRLILQDGGIQSVMSMQEIDLEPASPQNNSNSNANQGPSVSCGVLLNGFAAAPEVQQLCAGDATRSVACDDLLIATRVGVEQCN